MNRITVNGLISFIVFHCIAVWDVSQAYPRFQEHIPNGDLTPNPCAPEQIWGALGHWEPSRGTAVNKNPFGEDFKLAHFTYTVDLHYKDSDGDGVQNGEELNVILVNDTFWLMGNPISHPGICEPLDSPRCAAQTFRCPQITAAAEVTTQQTGNGHPPNINLNLNNNPFNLNTPPNTDPFANAG